MKAPHEYLEDAQAVRALFEQAAHSTEQHWQSIVEIAITMCLQDARRQIEALQEQLEINAQALMETRTRNGPPPRRIGEQPEPLPIQLTYKGEPDNDPPF